MTAFHSDKKIRKTPFPLLKKNQQGFSLIELIIVIAIMAILIGVMAPSLLRYIEKTKETKRIADADTFRRCYEIANIDVTTYQGITPESGGFLNILNNAWETDGTPGNDAYTQAVKKELDEIYTSKYDKLNMNISLGFLPSGEMYALYIQYNIGGKKYNYAYKPAAEFLPRFEEISGGWYRGTY